MEGIEGSSSGNCPSCDLRKESIDSAKSLYFNGLGKGINQKDRGVEVYHLALATRLGEVTFRRVVVNSFSLVRMRFKLSFRVR